MRVLVRREATCASSSPRCRSSAILAPAVFVGTWRSLVARLLWEQDVAGSNPVVPTSADSLGEGLRPFPVAWMLRIRVPPPSLFFSSLFAFRLQRGIRSFAPVEGRRAAHPFADGRGARVEKRRDGARPFARVQGTVVRPVPSHRPPRPLLSLRDLGRFVRGPIRPAVVFDPAGFSALCAVLQVAHSRPAVSYRRLRRAVRKGSRKLVDRAASRPHHGRRANARPPHRTASADRARDARRPPVVCEWKREGWSP